MVYWSLAMTVGREQLYQEVWAEPMTSVAARYGVSSSFLARVCAALNVPRPPRGYWAQLAVGKAAKAPPLPSAKPGDQQEWSRDGSVRHVAPGATVPPSGRTRRQSREGPRPAVHPLVAAAKSQFDKVRVSRDDYLKPTKQLVVDVFTTKPAHVAALELANVLFLALEGRGHQVTLSPKDQRLHRPVLHLGQTRSRDPYFQDSWRPGRPTVVFVGTVAVGLTVYEPTEKATVRWRNGKLVRVDATSWPRGARPLREHDLTHESEVPSGCLAIRGYSPYAGAEWEKIWLEAKAGELKTKLDGVVRAIEAAAPTIVDLANEARRRAELERQKWEIEQERRARAEAERRRIEATKESRAQLLEIVEHWALANRIEGFLEDVAHGLDGVPVEERAGLHDRLERARALLGGADGLTWFRSWKLPEER